MNLIIIGAGPAGLIAGIQAARRGVHVQIFEKNATSGRKLLITGGGRCNFTNQISDSRLLAEKYGTNSKALISVFHRVSPVVMRDFFQSCGVNSKEEDLGRVFPRDDRAVSILNALLNCFKQLGGTIRNNEKVEGFIHSSSEIKGIKTSAGIVSADHYILSTGGLSLPATGSTGEGLEWLKNLGLEVLSFEPALVPVIVQESWVKNLQGISTFSQMSVLVNDKRISLGEGDLLFTHFGLSGPLILDASSYLREVQKKYSQQKVYLELDLLPDTTVEKLEQEFMQTQQLSGKKFCRSYLSQKLPSRLADEVLRQSGVKGESLLNQISKLERQNLVLTLKKMKLTYAGTKGFDQAIGSSGGLAPKEVEFKTMKCKKIPNLSVVGDLLDFNRPCGGYSLQLCWATGWVAGESLGS